MAMDQAERDRRGLEKAERLQEADLRLKVRPRTKQALLAPSYRANGLRN